MKAIADYGVSLATYTQEKTWWFEFFKLTVAARLGLLMSWRGTETPEFDENLVLNKAVLSVLNNGCGVLEHALTADTSAERDRDPVEFKPGLVAMLFGLADKRAESASKHRRAGSPCGWQRIHQRLLFRFSRECQDKSESSAASSGASVCSCASARPPV